MRIDSLKYRKFPVSKMKMPSQSKEVIRVWVDRKANITQINFYYKQGMQKSVPEHTTNGSWKQIGYSSKDCSRSPLLSAKRRKLKLVCTDSTILAKQRSLYFCCDTWMIGPDISGPWEQTMSYLNTTVYLIIAAVYRSSDDYFQEENTFRVWWNISNECYQHLVEPASWRVRADFKT